MPMDRLCKDEMCREKFSFVGMRWVRVLEWGRKERGGTMRGWEEEECMSSVSHAFMETFKS
jgi:hypothetical protein